MNESLWLVGAGPMGVDHAIALKSLGRPFVAVGRSAASAVSFANKVGVAPRVGGVTQALSEHVPAAAIVAVGADVLAPVTRELMVAGVKRVLVEKPAGLTRSDVDELRGVADEHGAVVHVAYNRRSYASVARAREIIVADGGVLSVHFEFTELADRVARVGNTEIKAAWFVANSSHVVDLAFFFAGAPRTWSAFADGGLDFHPTASRFVGAGVTVSGALFSYCANWDSGGRWGVEVMTPQRRLIFRPLEELSTQKRSEIAVAGVDLGVDAEGGCKPGVRRMLHEWLEGESLLPTLSEHASFFATVLEPMLRGEARSQR